MRPELQSAATKALAAAGGDWQGAASKLITWALKSEDLRTELLAAGARRAIEAAFRADRARVAAGGDSVVTEAEKRRAIPVDATEAPGTRAVRAMATYSYDGLLGYAIDDGLRLGDARRHQVLEAARQHAAEARGSATRARWLMLVGSKLKDDQHTVGQVLRARELQTLSDLAEEHVAAATRGLLPRGQ